MRPCVIKGFVAVLSSTAFALSGFASPLSSKLLPLVPPGVEVVSGFENYHAPNAHGRLLLTTHNNRLDLEDWQALTGVDTKRIFHEAIEVAASISEGELKQHLLLVAGTFDRDRIFAAAEQNGAQRTEYRGDPVLLIQPFAREKGDMVDMRWMVILDNRIGLLGTPDLVRQALSRQANHAVADPMLQERLTQLRPDVTSWNVMVPRPSTDKTITFAQSRSAWASLQDGSDVLLVGARFGVRIRVDFSLHAGLQREPAFFHKKAAFFTSAFEAGSSQPAYSLPELQRRLRNFSVEPNRVQGSIELSDNQFSQWCNEITRMQTRTPQPSPHGD